MTPVRPIWMMLGVVATAALAGVAMDSTAVALVLFAYGVAGMHALLRQRERARSARLRTQSLEQLAMAAADLRAGSPGVMLFLPDPELDRLARAAQRMCDRTGAPLADLLDRLEAQQSALSRVDSAGHAQAAGIRITTCLLIALPLAGIGLGELMGVDAVAVLLHTPFGLTCTAIALALQLTGLAWADRLARAPVPRPARFRLRRRSRLAKLPLAPTPGPQSATRQSLGHALRNVELARLEAPLRSRKRARILLAKLPQAEMSGSHRADLRGPRKSGLPQRWEPRGSRVGVMAQAELALAADLMASALRAGAPVGVAVIAAGETLSGPLSAQLLGIGRELMLGVPADAAWQRLAGEPWARRLVAAAQRSAQSGAALAGAFARCADDLRVEAEHARLARTQRAAVLLVLPLGLCFLPAFLIAGLVPVMVAVLGEVL